MRSRQEPEVTKLFEQVINGDIILTISGFLRVSFDHVRPLYVVLELDCSVDVASPETLASAFSYESS